MKFKEFDLQSSANRFDWIVKESMRVRLLRQGALHHVAQQLKEEEMRWRRPLWELVDKFMDEHEEGARRNNTQQFKGKQSQAKREK